ncbi:MAG: hypothetical protein L3J79_07885 [Candidatus Marinimicrobia bacterium]|nr:hypothetical protein [Candidatus Neomarinimicrobiota bacterium]
MSKKTNQIHQLVKEAIVNGVALEAKDIRELRAKSKQATVLFKSVFWVGIVIFNIALWLPLPIEINKTLLYIVAFLALIIAVVVPIFGLKKHQVNLELLKVATQALKKRTASEAGKVYINQVKKQDRPFVVAEFELLNGSKWSAKADDSDV